MRASYGAKAIEVKTWHVVFDHEYLQNNESGYGSELVAQSDDNIAANSSLYNTNPGEDRTLLQDDVELGNVKYNSSSLSLQPTTVEQQRIANRLIFTEDA